MAKFTYTYRLRLALGSDNLKEETSSATPPAKQGDSQHVAFSGGDLDQFERGLHAFSIDLERADAETKARVSRDAFADLPPDAAMALRAKMGRLVPLWSEYKKLVAVAD